MLGEVRGWFGDAEERVFLLVAVEFGFDDAVGDLFDVDVVFVLAGDLDGAGAVLAELELDDGVRGVPDGAVVLGLEFESALMRRRWR